MKNPKGKVTINPSPKQDEVITMTIEIWKECGFKILNKNKLEDGKVEIIFEIK